MKTLVYLALLMSCACAARAEMSAGQFVPIYKGVDLAFGTNAPDGTDPRRQSVRCIRVDLNDPDVSLFADPKSTNYVANSSEAYSMTVSNFLVRYRLEVAVDANFYDAFPGGSNPNAEGIPCNVEGMLVTTGTVVSAAESGRIASLVFASNNVPSVAFTNRPPGVSTAGVFTAVTGYYPLLIGGVSIWADPGMASTYNSVYTPGDFSIHQPQPRTAFGISQDRRYLYLITIDGRQNGFSEGALDTETAAFLLLFGAWDAINMDGGGSTAMYMADCAGNPIAINHSSYPPTVNPRRERYVGAHFGISALPLSSFINNINARGGSTGATITWDTISNATSQVEYGLTPSFGSLSPLDSAMVSSHSVSLTGLIPERTYYFRVLSTTAAGQFASACANIFSTTNAGGYVFAYSLTNDWKWQTNNLDGVNWTLPSYSDSNWNHGPGTFWADSRGPVQSGIPLPTTILPMNPQTSYPFTTYYFRTHFNYPGDPASAFLTFSNYLDDGFVVYLNGVEINRLNVSAPTVNSTPATGAYCSSGNATCPYVFTLAGNTNVLRNGDNVVAVELHNVVGGTGTPSPDATFGQVLFFPAPAATGPGPVITNVVIIAGETNATITWQTLGPGDTRILYGTNASLGISNTVSSALVTNHSVTLSNLLPVTQYYFRVISSDGTSPFSSDGVFSTVPFYQPILPLSANWRYTTNDVSALNWMAPGYDDGGWSQGGGMLFVEDNTAVAPRTTLLPTDGSAGVFPTYYGRTHFTISNSLTGFVLLLTNFVDDGAVFYINGQEVQRVRMPAGPITYATLASGCPEDNCDATLEVPDVFRLSLDALTNVIMGDNVLAVEVHQVETPDFDVVLGTSIGFARASAAETRLHIDFSNNVLKLSWDGAGMILQHSSTFRETNTQWLDVFSNVTTSPFYLTNPPGSARFYRLRN